MTDPAWPESAWRGAGGPGRVLPQPQARSALAAAQPAWQPAPELLLRAQAVRLVLLDVDGVLTDGGLVFGAVGESHKRFHTLDGHGLKLLQRIGMAVGVISGRDSAALRARLDALGITRRSLGNESKLAAAQAVLGDLGLGWDQTAAMGDDWPDLPLLARSVLALAPPGAHPEVLARAHHVTAAAAGAGAVREACDLILSAQGHYAALLQEALQG